MTDLEAIKTMKSFLLKQGGQAVSDSGECKFRGSGNKRCAVGCLIPDDVYYSFMEDMGMSDIVYKVKCLKVLNMDMLLDAQGIHDDWVEEDVAWNTWIKDSFDSLEVQYCH